MNQPTKDVNRPTVQLTRADGSPLRVLVVDDEVNIAELLSMALHYEGWEISKAHSGRQAVSAAKRLRPDAVVLDIMLPDFDGVEVLRRMRADIGDVPVLFLTAKDSVEDRVAGLTAGGDDYVTKPLSLEEVVARLDAGRPLERNTVDVTRMVLESVANAHIVAPAHHWVLDLADEPMIVTGDERRLPSPSPCRRRRRPRSPHRRRRRVESPPPFDPRSAVVGAAWPGRPDWRSSPDSVGSHWGTRRPTAAPSGSYRFATASPRARATAPSNTASQAGRATSAATGPFRRVTATGLDEARNPGGETAGRTARARPPARRTQSRERHDRTPAGPGGRIQPGPAGPMHECRCSTTAPIRGQRPFCTITS
jgi:DNA-binding response OmpR family regulator